MILGIDTASRERIFAGLYTEKGVFAILRRRGRAQNLLRLLEALFRNARVSPKKLASIVVRTGAGSFTGIRIGSAAANAFGYICAVPVRQIDREISEKTLRPFFRRSAGRRKFQTMIPRYSEPPKVTMSAHFKTPLDSRASAL